MRHLVRCLLLIFTLNSFAQSSSDILLHPSPGWFELKAGVALSTEEFMANHLARIGLGPADDLQLLHQDTDAYGTIHTRMQQYYKGVPVEAAHIIFHESEGLLKTINGKPVPKLSLNVVPEVDSQKAIEAALHHSKAQQYIWGKDENHPRYPNPELVIAGKHFNGKAADYSLMYKVSVFSMKPLAYDHYFIDAHTGEVRFVLQGDHHGDATGVAVTRYSGTRIMVTDSLGPNHFELHSTSTPNEVLTLNVNQGQTKASLTPFTDSDNTWNNANAQMDEVATDVHWGTQATIEFYLNRYNWDVNGGLPIENWVHFNHNWSNAVYMDGIFIYGDGDQLNWGPYTSLDIVAHELTHSVINHSSGLIYHGESGSLNESFCDIFGVALRFARDSSQADYTVGDQCHLQGQPLRSLKNPGLNQQPHTYQGNNWLWASQYHHNNGVPNYWYYLLSEGGTGVNDNNFNYSLQGIGHRKAELIAFHNLVFYLTPTSDFYDARMGSLLAAESIYGTCSPELNVTAKAWEAVGVGQAVSGRDLALLEVTPHISCTLSANESFTFLVQNFGCTDTLPAGDTIRLFYSFDQQTPVEVNYVLASALAPGANILITDTTIHDLSTPGSWPLQARLQLSGDQDSDNDSLITEITHYGANRHFDLQLSSIDPRNSGCQATTPQIPTFYIFSMSCTPIPAGDTVYAGLRIFTDNGYSYNYTDTIVLNRVLRHGDRLWETDPLAPPVSGLYGQQSMIESWVYYAKDADNSNDTVPVRPFYKPYLINQDNPQVYHNLENAATSQDSMHLFDHRNFLKGQFNQNTARVDFRPGAGLNGSQGLHFSGEQEWFGANDTSFTGSGIYHLRKEKGQSAVCFCMDNAGWPSDSLFLEFDLRQTASLLWQYHQTGFPLSTSKLWIASGPNKISDYFFPSTHTGDTFKHHKIDLTPYLGVQEICLRAMNFISGDLDTIAGSMGDNVYLDNIHFHPGETYTSVDEIRLAEKVSLYPNPSGGQVWLEYKSTEPAEINVQIINSAGANLLESVYQAEGGTHIFGLSLKNYPPGIYLFRVHSGREVVTEKILLK